MGVAVLMINREDSNTASAWAWATAQHHIDAAKDSMHMKYPMDSVAHALIALAMIQLAGLKNG